MIEKLVEIGFLFDFYGKLLSERQYKVIELFYLQDLSLSEIGIELDITRQGVYDNLKRAEDNLYKYEETLGLAEKFKDSHKNIKKILEAAKEIEEIARDKKELLIVEKIKLIKSVGSEILENSWEVID